MKMVGKVDDSVREFGRQFEQPRGRFGQQHIVRDTLPGDPEISSFAERQEAREADMLRSFQEKAGHIAVTDTVEVRRVVPRLEAMSGPF